MFFRGMVRVLLWGALAGMAAAGWPEAAGAAGVGWSVGWLVWGAASEPPQQLINVFLPAPRALRQSLRRAKEAMEQKRYSDAVLELGALLADSPRAEGAAGQDYFLGSPGQPGAQSSLKAEAQRLLGEMPPAAREFYELQFGAEARALLEEGVREGSSEKLREAARKYFHTRAGYEAALLLGRYELDHGRPLAAALSLERLADSPAAAAPYEPELSVLLAACWLYAGLPEKAERTLAAARARAPEARLHAGGREFRWFADAASPLPWLERVLGASGLPSPGSVVEWRLFRGDPSRNARSAGGLPLTNPRWRAPTANDPVDERYASELARRYLDQRLPALPSLQPLAVRDVVLMRSPRRLIAVDFPTGKRIWEFPWFDSANEFGASEGVGDPRSNAALLRKAEVDQRLWSDALYGQMSSDGRSVFFLFDLGYALGGNFQRPVLIGPMGLRQANPNSAKPFNRLVALDLAKEGKLQWMVGGEDGEEEPKLAGAFFLGAPLPLQDRLYVLAEVHGEIRLVVLDAETGHLQWQQQLAHVDVRTIMLDPSRRMAGATPSFADGVLICPTSAGAVVALDVASRTLLWGYQYKQTGEAPSPIGWRVFPPRVERSGGRWADASATIAEGKVLLTPVESDYLYCLDLLTGQHVWPPQKREDGLYVAGVRNGVALLVGAGSVRAIRLADGRPAWPAPIPLAPDMPSGRGFLSGAYYYLPTTGAQLLKIDLSQGRVAARIETERPLGNLICYKDQVISQGADFLAAYYQTAPLRAQVAERLARNPDDSWALARRGELLLQEGKRDEALAVLRRAHRLAPRDDATRTLLIDTLLDAMRDDFAARRDLAREADSLIDQPRRRMEYLRLLADGLEQTGDREESFATYLKLARLHEQREEEGGSLLGDGLERAEPRLRVRLDRWVQAKLRELWEAAEPPERAGMEKVIQERFEAARADGDSYSLRRFLRYFGALPAADPARLLLADSLRQRGDWLEAELLLSRLEAARDKSIAAAAAARMAQLLLQTQRLDQAAEQYRRLAQDWSDTVCMDGKTGRQLAQEAIQASDPLRRRIERSVVWPRGKTAVEQTTVTASSYRSYQKVYPVPLREIRGPFPRGAKLSLDQRRSALVLRDGQGEQRMAVSLYEGQGFYSITPGAMSGRANGHLLVLAMGQELIALDTLRAVDDPRDAILWRQTLLEAAPSPLIRSPQLRIQTITNRWFGARSILTDTLGRPIGSAGPLNATGVCFPHLRELQCVDPLTGETVWTRENVDAGSEVFGDEQRIFVIPPNSDQALVLDALDGHLVDRRPAPRASHRWAACEGRILAMETTDRQRLQLRLYDVWSQRDLWRREFAEGSKASLVGQDEVAVFEPGGELEILSLRDDRTRVRATLAPAPALERIAVLRTKEQYLMVVSEAGGRPAGTGTVIAPAPGGPQTPLIRGRVEAFDRRTGQPQWAKPAEIDQYGLPLDQPAELPLLLFLRHVTVQNANPRRTHTSILCIDKRDGRTLLEQDLPGTTGYYSVVGDASRGQVRITLQNAAFTLTFTSESASPQSSARAGASGSETATTKSDGPASGRDRPVETARMIGEHPAARASR